MVTSFFEYQRKMAADVLQSEGEMDVDQKAVLLRSAPCSSFPSDLINKHDRAEVIHLAFSPQTVYSSDFLTLNSNSIRLYLRFGGNQENFRRGGSIAQLFYYLVFDLIKMTSVRSPES